LNSKYEQGLDLSEASAAENRRKNRQSGEQLPMPENVLEKRLSYDL